jgi:hypothetical protein
MQLEELPLPTFLIIGAQKSATRWLRMNLGLHPDIFTASTEIEFFNSGERVESMGLEWYRAQFEGWAGERFVGEATPGYMYFLHGPAAVAERIDTSLPEVRLIAILRNPVDRAQSALIHHIEAGALPPDTQLLEYVKSKAPERDRLGIIGGGWYASSLEPFEARFGDRLLILLHDDLDEDPRKLYDTAIRHVGASADFMPPELEKVRYSHQAEPSSDPNRQPLTVEQREEIYSYFEDDLARLEKMIDRDLSLWHPDEVY